MALKTLGSTRNTLDTDFLVNDVNSTDAFIFDKENNTDYINANGNKFFAAIWELEAGNDTGIASLKALLELKAYSFVQHCVNRNFKKADEAEFDIKFIIRMMGKHIAPNICKKFVTPGQYSEICKIITSVKF